MHFCNTCPSPLSSTSLIISLQTFSEIYPAPPKISLISSMDIEPLPSYKKNIDNIITFILRRRRKGEKMRSPYQTF
jgi:hypothetical protein